MLNVNLKREGGLLSVSDPEAAFGGKNTRACADSGEFAGSMTIESIDDRYVVSVMRMSRIAVDSQPYSRGEDWVENVRKLRRLKSVLAEQIP